MWTLKWTNVSFAAQNINRKLAKSKFRPSNMVSLGKHWYVNEKQLFKLHKIHVFFVKIRQIYNFILTAENVCVKLNIDKDKQ